MLIKSIVGHANILLLLSIISGAIILSATAVYSAPIGPVVAVLGNATKSAVAATKINASINGTISRAAKFSQQALILSSKTQGGRAMSEMSAGH